ncbi:MAG: tetratricopeptide repeat protein [Spirochaetia bacterium]
MMRKLLILKLTSTGFRARDLENNEIFSVKTSTSGLDPELNTVRFSVDKEWTFKKNKYLSGEVTESTFILENIDVPGHEYTVEGLWDPRGSFGDEAEELFPDYLAEGLREEYMFKNYSGYGFYEDGEDPFSDAIEAPTGKKRYDILAKLWEDYPECIDALVHIGESYMESSGDWLQNALNCFITSIHIAEKNLPKDFDGVMLWECLENRPYLRALHGLCLTYWRMKEFDKAQKTARKMLRICPGDNIGVRFIIDPIAEHQEWREEDWG